MVDREGWLFGPARLVDKVDKVDREAFAGQVCGDMDKG